MVVRAYHRIAYGEDIFMIAELYYGAWWLWEWIYDANRDRFGDDPESISVGMMLLIPELARDYSTRKEVEYDGAETQVLL